MTDAYDISQDFSAYLDRELPAAQAHRVEAAVAAVQTLAEELCGLRRARGLLRALPLIPAPHGFLARVLAEARRRGLLAGGPRGAGAMNFWLSRLAAAAVVLVGAAVGTVVLKTVRDQRPSEPVAVAPAPSPILAHADDRASVPAPPATAAPAAPDHVKLAAKPSATFGKGGGTAGGAQVAHVDALQPPGPEGALAERLKAAAGVASAGDGEVIELQVAHVGAARRELLAALAASGIHPAEADGKEGAGALARAGGWAMAKDARGAVASEPALEGGRATVKKEAMTAGTYREAPAAGEGWQVVVTVGGEQADRLMASLAALRRGRANDEANQGLCLEDAALLRGRPAAPGGPGALPSAASAPAGSQPQAPFHIAHLQRLDDRAATMPAARPTQPTPTTQPAAEAAQQARPAGPPRRIVIHLRPTPGAQADPMRNIRQ